MPFVFTFVSANRYWLMNPNPLASPAFTFVFTFMSAILLQQVFIDVSFVVWNGCCERETTAEPLGW